MKKIIILSMFSISILSYGQLLVQNDGTIRMRQNSQYSYLNFDMILTARPNYYGILCETNLDYDGGYCITALVNRPTTYAFRSVYNGGDKFRVAGEGWIWAALPGYVSSDKKYKTNIKTLNNSLDKVVGLAGVIYQRKKDTIINKSYSLVENPNAPFEIGLIAQDVEKFVPEVVKTMNDSTKSISYTGLIPLLIEAIKEQQLQINDLKTAMKGGNKNKSFNINSVSDTTIILNYNNLPVLYQNTPNPFNIDTDISCFLPENIQTAYLKIYTAVGFEIKSILLTKRNKMTITVNATENSEDLF